MNFAWFDHPRLEQARRWVWAITDRLAFVVESACVANAVFGFITFAALGFSWRTTAHEWGNFWTHYVSAAASARAPVEHVLLGVLATLTVLTAFIRAPKARPCWAPWPLASASAAAAAATSRELVA